MIAFRMESRDIDRIMERADRARINQDDVAHVGGRGVANLLRDHYFQLDRSLPNKLGGPRTHFWGQVARSVQNPVTQGGAAAVSINHVGLAQRLFGGIIRAGRSISSATGKLTQFLSIPARAEAYGKTPGQFNDLEFVPTRRGGGMLVQTYQSLVGWHKRSKSWLRHEVGGLVMFWLVKEVDQKPDPRALPREEFITAAATNAMNSYLSRRLATN